MKERNINYTDLIPALSGLIGKIALVSSFAMVWAKELQIINANFVLENVRVEILVGSIITVIAAILFPKAAPAGTLAPLVVIVPQMVAFGVHPLILGSAVGVIGIVIVKIGIFKRLVELAGFICKTSLALCFGISGILMSAKKLYSFFNQNKKIFVVLIVVLILVYSILFYAKKSWLVIPIASIVAFVIPFLFHAGFDVPTTNIKLNLSPFYWWNDMWGIGFGLNGMTILKTIPFAFFVLLLWTIDTVSIQSIRDASYGPEDEIEPMDVEQSFLIVSIRNIVGALFGGAQTGSLWRSFLIPLYMVKRPMRVCAGILGITGIIASLTVLPIQILSYPPLVWSVLLFGIFMPFTVTAVSNIIQEGRWRIKLSVICFSLLGIGINPILTWICAVIYERNHSVEKLKYGD